MTSPDLLEALRSGAVLASVKPLEWVDPHPSVTFPEWYARRVDLRLGYTIRTGEISARGKFALFSEIGGKNYWLSGHKNLDEAKAAAQADYGARILSALSPDHTAAVVALIEGLRKERDFWENRENEALKRALAAEAEREALRERAERAEAGEIAWRSAFQRVTPGGSEFMDPKAVRAWADMLKTDLFNANKRAVLAERRALKDQPNVGE